MAVIQVGTPAALSTTGTGNRTASGSVTGTWNGTQPRTAGHLLVACVTATGTTSAAATANTGGTWTKLLEAGAGTKALAAIWVKNAAGGDAAPAFTSAVSGTATMSCTLYELSGAAAAAIQPQTSGTGTAASSTAVSVTTAGSVSAAGEFAIGVMAAERGTAATRTIAASGTGYTLDASDATVSSTGHAGCISNSSPAAGSASTGGLTLGSGTSSTESGALAVFAAPPVAAAKTGSLADAFPGTTVDTTKWSPYGTYSVAGGAVTIAADTTYGSGIVSLASYDLTGSGFAAQVTPYTANPDGATWLQFQAAGGGTVGIEFEYGVVRGYWTDAAGGSSYGTGVTYDPVAMAWWRVREQSGTCYADYSADGYAWVNLWSSADPAVTLTSGTLQFSAGIDTGTPGTASAANFNVITRSQFTWPFSWDSVWNMPVSAAATYTPSGITVTSDYSTDPTAVEYCCTDSGQPVKTLSNAMKADGTIAAESVYVPPSMSAAGQWNMCAAFLGTDGDTVYQGETLLLTAGGSPSFAAGGAPNPGGAYPVPAVSIKSTGITGPHGGSNLSALGGTLTVADLTGSGPIRHAMKVCFNGYLFYSSAGTGYTWPASNADSGYNTPGNLNYYGGSNPYVVVGALLALPPSVSPSKYTDPLVQKLATAMQCYGAYIVDNTAAGPGVDDALIELNWDAAPYFTGTGTFSSDFHQLLMDLQVVTSSTASAPGGGAIGSTRYAPYAPMLADGTGVPPAAAVVTPAPLAESGAASDTLSISSSGGATAVGLTESGTASQVLAVAQLSALTESGTGTQALAVAAAVFTADAGTAADTLAAAAALAVPLADAGGGADVLAAALPAVLADGGHATDILSAAGASAVPLADAAAAADALAAAVTAAAALFDAGSGTVVLGVSAGAALADAGTGTDAAAPSAAVYLTEAGTAADSAAAVIATQVSITDAAAGADTAGVTAALPVTLSDAGSAADTLAAAAALAVPLADSGHAADTAGTVLAAVSIADLGAAADGSALAVLTALADAGAAADLFHAPPPLFTVGRLTASDAAAGTLTASSSSPGGTLTAASQ